MAEDLFKFKQFDLYQKKGFRLSTEACLFGAYVSKYFHFDKVLEIGTGTGILSLMYAQNHPDSKITAIEIDTLAAQQAKENFENSPWKHIHIVNDDINKWAYTTRESFELIISNPPFFKNHLLGSKEHINIAKHQSSLSLDDLTKTLAVLPTENSLIAILLPVSEQKYFMVKMAFIGFYPYKTLNVFNQSNTPQFRKIVVYSREKEKEEVSSLIIYDNERKYSDSFVELLNDYYIIF